MHDVIPPGEARLLDELTGIVSRAAAAILAARASGLKTRAKADTSPVTAADEASEAIIVEGVAQILPGVAVVSEELSLREPPKRGEHDLVLVDPVDGTRELVAGRDEFCINLALVREGRLRLGIIAAPVLGLIWRTAAGGGAERMRLAPGAPPTHAADRCAIRTRTWPTRPVAIVSRSHLDAPTQAFLARLPAHERLASGSAIKLCRVAEGGADVYPRLGRVHQWDVAAGEAILTAAGGRVSSAQGGALQYGATAPHFLVPGFVAWGDAAAPRRFGLEAVQGDSIS
jgi:3'(2'), 5'-bisphosphate nucleotidase